MVASDVVDYLGSGQLYGVVATDISRTALDTARQGRYSRRKLETIPLAIRNKHVSIDDECEGQIKADLKQRVCFVQGNIVDINSWPQMRMDVIYCQNLLVYFQRQRQHEVLNSLVEHLNPGGLLVLAPAEASGWSHPVMQRHPDEMALAYIKRQQLSTGAKGHGG
jgi:chemotaxis protein methyltransferase CheR/type IV pilus assembly protein PilK